MIKLKDLLIDRGYTYAKNYTVYHKTITEDIKLTVYSDAIYFHVRVYGMDKTVSDLLKGKTFKDYFTSLGFDQFGISWRAGDIALINKTIFNSTRLSNKTAKQLTDFLDILENKSIAEKIAEKIQDIVDKILAGDDDLKEVKTYNELKDFIESKGLTIDTDGTVEGKIKAYSYEYSFRIPQLVDRFLVIDIAMYDDTYKKYFSAIDNTSSFLKKIDTVVYDRRNKYTNLFPPFTLSMYLLNTWRDNSTNDIWFRCNKFSYWDDEDRINFIKKYIELFTDPDEAKNFFDLICEFIEELVEEES